jgi:hypothetical protein
MQTERVELADGNWAVLRTTRKLRDTAEQRHAAHTRGFEDDYLDALVLLRLRIVEWSFGPVTDEAIGELDDEEAVKLFRVINGTTESPNGSAPSSTGMRRTKARNEEK